MSPEATLWSDQRRAGKARGRLQAAGIFARLSFAWYLCPILLLALFLRAYRFGLSDLSVDEAVSFFIASKPLFDIVAYTMRSIWEHPPGYYLFLHLWMALAGQREFALRFLSGLGGVTSVALLATLARRWFNARVALLAALLMAVQPLAVWAGYNVRMYAWLNALALLSVYLLDRALIKNRWRDWGMFAAATLLAILFHYLAGVLLLCYAAFLLLAWRHLPTARWRLAAVLALLCLPLAWLLLYPGPRQSLAAVLERALHERWTIERLRTIYLEWAFSGDLGPRLQGLLLAAIPWGLSLAGVLVMPEPRPPRRHAALQRLLLALLLLPPLLGSLLFVVVASRHHSALLCIFALGAALCIDVLYRRQRVVGLLALLAIVGLDTVVVAGAVGERSWRPFSKPMDYISARAAPGDALGFTYFFDWTLAGYYNERQLPTHFIPADNQPLPESELATRVAGAWQGNRALWLMIYPGSNDPHRIEETFNRVAYAADKTWFADGRGVIHYFSPQPLQDYPGGMAWDAGSRLNRWQASAPRLQAGDALRLRFEWQRTGPIDGRALVALNLYGPDGQVWARRVSEPCNGLCPITEWTSAPVVEQAALYVPPDVPPGEYTLRLGWSTPEGAPLLGQAPGDQRSISDLRQVDLPLLTVRVDAPHAPAPPVAPHGRTLGVALRPGLTLAAADFAAPSLRAGSTLVIPTQWQITAAQPLLNLRLHLRQRDGVATVEQPLGPAWYPSDAWTPGLPAAPAVVRTQPAFVLPGTLAPGSYQATLGVVGADGVEPAEASLGTVTVQDRPHSFDLPSGGTAAGADWEEGIRLARFDVPAAATPGSTVPVTLVWQAGRPTGANWKVFVHLSGNGAGAVSAQHDAYPVAGEAPTTTWQPGEVITDVHPLTLPPDLAAGSYQVQVGLYEEKTGRRLALAAGGDTFTLPSPLVVRP